LEVGASQPVGASFRDGRVELDDPQTWPDGLQLQVTPVFPLPAHSTDGGQVIVVGFGLAGRCVADLLDRAKLAYTIIERNPVTVETQRALGRRVVLGDAGLHNASIIALTIPDEAAVLEATTVARRLRPQIYIIARTNYASQGMRARQLGADDVIKAEQAVAVQFYDRLSVRLGSVLAQTE
jgi:CPA2 family monovalent cation:H+ antiporter-2